MKKFINKILVKTLGYPFSKYRSKQDKIFETQKYLCERDTNPVIFDVGAFTGETALTYLKYFGKDCLIHSFEPFPESFKKLEATTQDLTNVSVHNVALGQKGGTVNLHVNNFLATNSILPSDPKGIEAWGSGLLETKSKLEVPMLTIDSFVEDYKIKKIDILKMDTQGSEYLVLEGAEKTIKAGKIKVIFAEIIVMPTYKGQMDFDDIFKMYKDYGFELYSLFNSTDKNEKLKYMDGIFVYNPIK